MNKLNIIDQLVVQISKSLIPIIGPNKFDEDLTLGYSMESTAIWISIKEKRGRVVVDIASPVVMRPKITQGILETINSYNLEENIFLIFIDGESSMVIARCELDGEFFNVEEFELKLSQLTRFSLSLSPTLNILWAGQTFEEFQRLKK